MSAFPVVGLATEDAGEAALLDSILIGFDVGDEQLSIRISKNRNEVIFIYSIDLGACNSIAHGK